MFTALLKSLNIERREATMVFLLIFQSFFIGTYFATLENSATTLFIGQYGGELLGWAFAISGVLGMVFTGFFSFLQSQIRFSIVITLNILFIAGLTFAMWYSYRVTDWEWLNFTIFSLMGALYILSLVGFSGMASRLFTLRQGKRLFSIIDSGLVFGMILMSLAIPPLLELIPAINDMILISAISAFVAFIFQSIIIAKYKMNDEKEDEEAKEEQEETESVGFGKFIGNRYIRLLTLFVILSMITLFFTSYNFLEVSNINYPEEKDFSSFFASFIIAVMAFSFVLKFFVYSKLVKTYGLKVNLMVTPVLIGIFAFVAAFVGGIFGYEEASASFVIFFLLISLVRFFSINLKDSIQTPSLRLLFQPLDVKIRYNVQAKVEGLVNEFSAVFSGLILMGLAALPFMELIHYSYILLVVIAAWIYITIQLYKEYQNMLRNSLVEYKKKQQAAEAQNTQSKVELEQEGDMALKKIEKSLAILKDYEPILFDLKLDSLLQQNSIKAKELAIKSIDESEVYSSIKELKEIAKKESNPELKKMAESVRAKLEKNYKDLLDEEKIVYMAKSKSKEDRIKAAKIIGYSGNMELSSLLKNLLKDLDPQVKLQSIRSVVKLNNPELYLPLIDQLSNEQYRSAAESAIIQVGEPILESLEKSFYKSGAKFESLISIIGLFGKIEGEKSIKYLVKKLNDPNRQIVMTALDSLRALNYSATDESITSQIFQAIEQSAAIAAWNIAAKFDVSQQKLSLDLEKAMDHEIRENFNTIFLLLSLVYDPESIQHIRENIESGTTEGVSFAIEMLDLFIADQPTGSEYALPHDTRAAQKIQELELHFPVNIYGNSDILKQIMNRSGNYLDNFTRACAVYAFLKLEGEERAITNDVVANLFNPDPLLSETAAVVMNDIDSASYDRSKDRLEENRREFLETSISKFGEKKEDLLIEKVIFLNSMPLLKTMDQKILEDMAIFMKYNKCAAGTNLFSNDGNGAYILLKKGNASLKTAKAKLSFEAGNMVHDMVFLNEDDASDSVISESELEYYTISNSDFKSLLFKYPALSDTMLDIFEQRLKHSNVVV